MLNAQKIVITGGAGLVGQNLITKLEARGFSGVVAIDKHSANAKILAELHPRVEVIEADLSQSGAWEEVFSGADILVLNHAQIGGLEEEAFFQNNVIATQNVIAAAQRCEIPTVVHISSSVVNSQACDFYTETKTIQEKLVADSGLPVCVLRPTLMFGWFDRKHLGWLGRFMQRVPVFPIPGSGHYLRQPLYVGDFCDIIISCMEKPRPGQVFNISGQEKIDYIELIQSLKTAIQSKTLIVRIPYGLFWLLLKIYALINPDPPFTVTQLKALATPDVFEVINWPEIFGVRATPLEEALTQTFRDPTYSKVVLEF